MEISLTLIIIIVTVVISLAAFNNESIFRKGLMNPYLMFQKGEYWRLISSGFLHGSYVHLGFNMFTFYFFGSIIEARMSKWSEERGIIVDEQGGFRRKRGTPDQIFILREIITTRLEKKQPTLVTF